MYYLIKKNQKKLLAIFGALLMVVFIIPPAAKYGNSHHDPVVAKVGDTDITDSQMRLARDEWELVYGIGIPDPRLMQQRVRLPYLMLPPAVVQQIQDHPELFLLLQLEAKEDGLAVDPDQARSLVANIQNDIDVTSPRAQEAVRAAGALLLVQAEVNRLGNAVKVSAPVWQHAAQAEQMVRLNLVEFPTGEYVKNVSVPTPEQLRQQFEKYRNDPPRAADAEPSKDNPLGFGYQLPARVKLQYVAIPHAQVMEAVKGDANHRYELQVQAAEYYEAHKEEFHNTPPATRPATAPATTQASADATQPATTAEAAASQPAIKPFTQVRDQIVDKLIATDVQQRTASIEKEVVSRLASDWISIRRADPSATQPAATEPASTQPALATTAPASQPAGELRSLARLEQIRDEIQKQFGVLVSVHDIARDWQTTSELSKLPGIGTARTEPPAQEAMELGVTFPQYAMSFAERPGSLPVVPLQVWEPSQPLTDFQQNAYVFRLSAAEPAHAPPDMAPLADQVARDWRLAQAYDQAKQAAQKLLDAAKAVGLSQAARTGSLTVISAGPFSPQSTESIPGYSLPDRVSREQLGAAAANLLKEASVQDPHPIDLVELPVARRVIVAELGSATLPTFQWLAQLRASGFAHQERFRKLADEWFSYDRVVSRMHYVPEETAKHG